MSISVTSVTPMISVLMCVYDSESYLRESIESILNQTYQDFEFIIVSEYDTSHESVRTIESYSDERIRHLHNSRRLGLVSSLNVGLNEAQGKFIAKMDADDVSKRERFRRQVDYLGKHPDIGVLGTAIEIIDDKGIVNGTRHPPTDPMLMKWSLMYDDEIANSSVMVRRSLFDLCGGYTPELSHGEDYDLWLRLAHVTKIVNLPHILHQRRIHGNQITQRYLKILSREVSLAEQTITATMGHEIPHSIALALAKSFIENADQAFQAAVTLQELYSNFTARNDLTFDQMELIRHDTARRMVTLSRLAATKNPLVSIRILFLMSKFCPSELPFWIREAVLRATRYLLKHLLPPSSPAIP